AGTSLPLCLHGPAARTTTNWEKEKTTAPRIMSGREGGPAVDLVVLPPRGGAMWPDELQRWAEAVLNDERILARLTRLAGSRERAEEALQEALSRAPSVYARGTFAGLEHFGGWVVVVARNYLAAEWRRLCRQRQLRGGENLREREDNAAA